MRFGDKLRELLEINELSQKELGSKLNIAPSTIGNYVRNIREPDHTTLLVFSKFFNVSIDYLLDNTVVSNSSSEEQLLVTTYRKLNEKNRRILSRQAITLYQIQNEE